MTSLRAKYQCNSKLAEYIKLANIIPIDFDFEWARIDEEENDSKFNEWLVKLSELSVEQTARLFAAKIDIIEFPLAENFSDKLTKQDIINLAGVALVKYLKIKQIRSFLGCLIRINELSEDKHIRALTPDNDIFQTLYRLHSNTKELFKLPAAQKVYKTLKDSLLNIDEKKMMGIVVQYTAMLIRTHETENHKLNDEEIIEFLVHSIDPLDDKIGYSSESQRTLLKCDLLAYFQLEIESRLSTVNVSVNQDGIVHFELNEFAKSLQGVDISRLRFCGYCGEIFWAKNKGMKGCSPRHARNIRMSVMRKNWKENGDLYLKARKKKQQKKESKSDGNL